MGFKEKNILGIKNLDDLEREIPPVNNNLIVDLISHKDNKYVNLTPQYINTGAGGGGNPYSMNQTLNFTVATKTSPLLDKANIRTSLLFDPFSISNLLSIDVNQDLFINNLDLVRHCLGFKIVMGKVLENGNRIFLTDISEREKGATFLYKESVPFGTYTSSSRTIKHYGRYMTDKDVQTVNDTVAKEIDFQTELMENRYQSAWINLDRYKTFKEDKENQENIDKSVAYIPVSKKSYIEKYVTEKKVSNYIKNQADILAANGFRKAKIIYADPNSGFRNAWGDNYEQDYFFYIMTDIFYLIDMTKNAVFCNEIEMMKTPRLFDALGFLLCHGNTFTYVDNGKDYSFHKDFEIFYDEYLRDFSILESWLRIEKMKEEGRYSYPLVNDEIFMKKSKDEFIESTRDYNDRFYQKFNRRPYKY